MQIRKMVRALIPTVQFGNLTYEVELVDEIDSTGLSPKEKALLVIENCKLMNQLIANEYKTLTNEVEKSVTVEQLTRIGK